MTQEDTQYRNEIIDKDEVLKMARESGMDLYGLGKDRYRFVHHLEAFAKLVAEAAASKEREECKKLCTWKTGNQFVDEAIAVCYRAIDQRGGA